MDAVRVDSLLLHESALHPVSEDGDGVGPPQHPPVHDIEGPQRRPGQHLEPGRQQDVRVDVVQHVDEACVATACEQRGGDADDGRVAEGDDRVGAFGLRQRPRQPPAPEEEGQETPQAHAEPLPAPRAPHAHPVNLHAVEFLAGRRGRCGLRVAGLAGDDPDPQALRSEAGAKLRRDLPGSGVVRSVELVEDEQIRCGHHPVIQIKRRGRYAHTMRASAPDSSLPSSAEPPRGQEGTWARDRRVSTQSEKCGLFVLA